MNRNIQRYNRYGWPVMSYFSDMKYAKEMRIYGLKDFFINLYVGKRLEANKYGEKKQHLYPQQQLFRRADILCTDRAAESLFRFQGHCGRAVGRQYDDIYGTDNAVLGLAV